MPDLTPSDLPETLSEGERDDDLAELEARDYLTDMLRPIGVDEPESIAEALLHAGLTIVAAASPSPTEGMSRAALQQIVAWDNHAHDTERDPTCPTCYAAAALATPATEGDPEPGGRLTAQDQRLIDNYRQLYASGGYSSGLAEDTVRHLLRIVRSLSSPEPMTRLTEQELSDLAEFCRTAEVHDDDGELAIVAIIDKLLCERLKRLLPPEPMTTTLPDGRAAKVEEVPWCDAEPTPQGHPQIPHYRLVPVEEP